MATTIKDVRERLNYIWDFSDSLNSDEEIDTYTITVSPDLILEDDFLEDAKITTILSGGVDNATEQVDVLIDTDQGNSYVQQLFITTLDGRDMTQSETDIVREFVGDVDSDGEIVTDSEINRILYKYKDLEASQRIYKTVIETLIRMKSLYAQSAYRSRDRELNTEVEEYGNERYEAICNLLDYWNTHPQDIISDISVNVVKIGGVRKDEYNKITSNQNGLNGVAKLRRSYCDRMSYPQDKANKYSGLYRSWRK